MRERFTQQGIEPVGSSPTVFSTHIRSEIAKWTNAARTAGVQASMSDSMSSADSAGTFGHSAGIDGLRQRVRRFVEEEAIPKEDPEPCA